MYVKDYKKIPRLAAGENVGKQHITVERHISLDYPQHWHEYFEVEIILGGSGTHIFNGVAYPISKGDAYLLTPLDFHKIEASAPIELINVSFDDVWLPESIRTFLYTTNYTKTQRFEGTDYEQLLMAAELLRRECETNAPCIAQLLEYLLSRFALQAAKETGEILNQAHLTGIKKAVAYIEVHFREKVTLPGLAAIAGYNQTYFSELFQKITGETYIERLTKLRINYAKILLSKGLSVSDACFESGFGSLSNFLTVFKAKCGMSPSKYREKCKKTQ